MYEVTVVVYRFVVMYMRYIVVVYMRYIVVVYMRYIIQRVFRV